MFIKVLKSAFQCKGHLSFLFPIGFDPPAVLSPASPKGSSEGSYSRVQGLPVFPWFHSDSRQRTHFIPDINCSFNCTVSFMGCAPGCILYRKHLSIYGRGGRLTQSKASKIWLSLASESDNFHPFVLCKLSVLCTIIDLYIIFISCHKC